MASTWPTSAADKLRMVNAAFNPETLAQPVEGEYKVFDTGRRHQIRAHLGAQDLPVAADRLYGDGQPLLLSRLKPDYRPGAHPERPLLQRQGLHAYQLEIEHPLDQEKRLFEAHYPKDLASTLHYLRK